ncbi:MAG TPA: hypothetical protein VFH39_00870, partial [Candidatus Saccharimonadales bacterium]|nr:hypothetical protein [Candidatus Saccharimonadales bacterium]
MTPTVDQLEDLYSDTKTCAKLVGLSYIEDETDGIGRRKHGKGFSYVDSRDQVIADRQLKRRITELVIP